MFLFPKRNDRDVNNIANYTFKAQNFLFVNERFLYDSLLERRCESYFNLTSTELANTFFSVNDVRPALYIYGQSVGTMLTSFGDIQPFVPVLANPQTRFN